MGNVAQLYTEIASGQAKQRLGLRGRQRRRPQVADLYAERLVLGSLLQHGRRALEAAALAGLRPEHFYEPRYGQIYERILALRDQDYTLADIDPDLSGLVRLILCWNEVEQVVWQLDIQAWYTQSRTRHLFATPSYIVTRELASYLKRLARKRQRRGGTR